MFTHDREDIAREMGHVWRGFSQEQIREWGELEGFAGLRFHSITPDPAAKGPSLFAAVIEKTKQHQPNSLLYHPSSTPVIK
jgi:hypothetical protein